jgi:hypothetical protein
VVVLRAPARYDGHAEWYDETFAVFVKDVASWRISGTGWRSRLPRCGVRDGRYAATITDAGFRLVGMDISA